MSKSKGRVYDSGFNHGMMHAGLMLLISGIAWEFIERKLERKEKLQESDKAWGDAVVSTNGQAELAEETDKHKVMGFGSRSGK